MTRARLDINPSLINFVSPMGNAFKTAGDALVDLGTQKVKDAKEEAAKNELKAKETASMNALATKNRVINPEASNRVLASYGIDQSSPLANPTSPTQANADLGLVDLGHPQRPQKPNYDQFKAVDGNLVDVSTGKVVYKSTKAPTTDYTQKYVEFYTDDNGNRVGVQGSGAKNILGKTKETNPKTAQIPEGYMPTKGLSPDAFRWALDNDAITRVDNQAYISSDNYKKARGMALFGDVEVE